MTINALVLAGSRPGGDPFAREVGVAHKGLIDVAGQPILARVIGALGDACCERILVCCEPGPVEELAHALGAETIPPAAGPSQSVLQAMEACGTPLLVTTSDHALLRGEWVTTLVDQAPDDCDVALMLAERSLVEAAVPNSRRTYLRFADGQWSGCNLFLLRTPAARLAVEEWTRAEAERKRPWRLAMRLGLRTLFDYLAGRLGVADAISRIGSRMGVRAALVPAPNGLAAVDVDKMDDLVLVRTLFANGA